MEHGKWYAVFIFLGGRRGVLSVLSTLEKLGMPVETKAPVRREQRVKFGKIEEIDRSVFPKYMFIRCNPDQVTTIDQALIEAHSGYVLKMEDIPTQITEAEMEYIKTLEVAHLHQKVITLVNVGTYVEISAGPFIGYRGRVLQSTRNSVTVETFVFGRSTPVEVPPSAVLIQQDYNEETDTDDEEFTETGNIIEVDE